MNNKQNSRWLIIIVIIAILLVVGFIFILSKETTAYLKKLKDEKQAQLQDAVTQLTRTLLRKDELDRLTRKIYLCFKIMVASLFIILNILISLIYETNIFETLLTTCSVCGIIHLIVSSIVLNKVISIDELLSYFFQKCTQIIYKQKNFDPNRIPVIESSISNLQVEIKEIDQKIKEKSLHFDRSNDHGCHC